MNQANSKFRGKRLLLLVILLTLFWLGLEANLFRLQIVQKEMFRQAAKNQYEKKIKLPAQRGTIYDRKGSKIVTNVIYYDIAADPKMVQDKTRIARECANAFSRSERYYMEKLKSNTHFVYLARRVNGSKMGNLLKLKDQGLVKTENFRRYYPYKSYAAQLIGFTDPDDHGLSGLELQYENELKGKEGEAVLQYDGPRRVFYNADYPLERPVQGNNLVLTIDKDIQTVVEQELKNGVEQARAVSGMAVIMDPNTGEILAMANYPSFDPNNHKHYDSDLKRNKVLTDVFEPGSTMKIVTAAALLQERIHKESDLIFCENGSYKIYNHRIRDTKKHGWMDFRKVIEHSSNIGMVKLSEDLPSNTLFRYLKNFGFGSKTNPDFMGEANGLLKSPEKWSGLSRASISIGQEIGGTAIQVAAAYSSVVNGGYLLRPFLVSHMETPDGSLKTVNKREVVRQVVSPEVSDILKSFMRGVVKEGTGKEAYLAEVEVGGKTGTAQKINPKTGTYYDRKYMASFVGFAPYDEPKYVCAIFIDEPAVNYYGGQSAAPVFREIIHRIINLNSAPSMNEIESGDYDIKLVEKNNKIPPIEGFWASTAFSFLDARDHSYKVTGEGVVVKKVSMDDDELVLELGPSKIHMDNVPNLKNLSLREAMARVDFSKLTLRVQGSGIVKKQSLDPGTSLKNRRQMVLYCE